MFRISPLCPWSSATSSVREETEDEVKSAAPRLSDAVPPDRSSATSETDWGIKYGAHGDISLYGFFHQGGEYYAQHMCKAKNWK